MSHQQSNNNQNGLAAKSTGSTTSTTTNTIMSTSEQEDLDSFLTTIESKLRGPFSSLDLAKAVKNNALRGTLTPIQYLQNLSKVIFRTDKVIQCRMLIGLLGLDPESSNSSSSGETGGDDDNDGDDPNGTTKTIFQILQQAQSKEGGPKHEEWVRVTAGLIQGIMFQKNVPSDLDDPDHGDDDQEEADNAKRRTSREEALFQQTAYLRTSRGEEATRLLDQLCDDVCTTLEDTMDQVLAECEDNDNDEDPNGSSYLPPDLNASYCPYRYALLPERLWKPLIPECGPGKNPHFKVNENAEVLKIDERLDEQRAKEELEHQGPLLMKTKLSSSAAAAAADTMIPANLPPGFRPTKLVSNNNNKAGNAKTSTSMFMPKKPNPMLAQRQKQQQQLLQSKTGLRRKGTAQTLVNSTSMKEKLMAKAGPATAAATATTSAAAAGGAAAAAMAKRAGAGGLGASKLGGRSLLSSAGAGGGGRFGSAAAAGSGGRAAVVAKSKMKMIDIQEVDSLTKEHAAREETATASKLSKKRRIMDAAMQRAGLTKKSKTTSATTTNTTPTGNNHHKDSTLTDNNDTTNATGTEDAADTSMVSSSSQPSQAQPNNNNSNGNTNTNEDWQTLLQDRSNKLSPEDRERVQQFFQDQFNPTPQQSIVKMKLHEQRSTDPETGQALKETFYLELDYTNFTSKQSKKVKRY